MSAIPGGEPVPGFRNTKEVDAMATAYRAEEKFWQARRALTGRGTQRDRLEIAFMDHLATLQPKELPAPCRAKFTHLRELLLPGIEKMSDEQVADLVQQILDLHDSVIDQARPYPFPK